MGLIVRKKASKKQLMDMRNKILDIAMNLNRIGNWAADDYYAKKKRIKMFLENTTKYLQQVDKIPHNSPFKKTFDRFMDEYPKLKEEGLEGPKKPLWWAEKMMTWGYILTHRSTFLSK